MQIFTTSIPQQIAHISKLIERGSTLQHKCKVAGGVTADDLQNFAVVNYVKTATGVILFNG